MNFLTAKLVVIEIISRSKESLSIPGSQHDLKQISV